MIFHFRLFQGKTNENIFQKMQKTAILAHFGPIFLIFRQKTEFNRIFLKIQLFYQAFFFLFFFSLLPNLTKYLCAKFQKKSNEWIPGNTSLRRTRERISMNL